MDIVDVFENYDIARPARYTKKKSKPIYNRETYRVGPPSEARSKKDRKAHGRNQELNAILDDERGVRKTTMQRLHEMCIAEKIKKQKRGEEYSPPKEIIK